MELAPRIPQARALICLRPDSPVIRNHSANAQFSANPRSGSDISTYSQTLIQWSGKATETIEESGRFWRNCCVAPTHLYNLRPARGAPLRLNSNSQLSAEDVRARYEPRLLQRFTRRHVIRIAASARHASAFPANPLQFLHQVGAKSAPPERLRNFHPDIPIRPVVVVEDPTGCGDLSANLQQHPIALGPRVCAGPHPARDTRWSTCLQRRSFR